MNEAKKTSRIPWIDALKGLTILAVVIGHCLNGYLNANSFPEVQTVFRLLHDGIYAYHMPLFFLISGYTFYMAYVRDGTLDRRRFFIQLGNLVLLYVVWAVLLWVSKRIFAARVNHAYDLRDLLGMFLTPLGNYWYIYILALIYILVWVFKLWKKQTLLLVVGTFAVLFAAKTGAGMLHQTVVRLCSYLFYFCVGIALYRVPRLVRQKWLFVLSAVCTVAFWHLKFQMETYRIVDLLLDSGLALAMSYLFVYAAAVIRWKEHGFLQMCGTYCLHIYLIHPYLTAGNRTFLPMLGITQPYMALVINAVSSLLISLGIAVVCQKLPWTMILFRPAAFIQTCIHKK